MLKRVLCTTAFFCLPAAPTFAQTTYATLDGYLRDNGMIRVPTSLQPYVMPGALLVVKWQHGPMHMGWRLQSIDPARRRDDVNEPTKVSVVKAGAIRDTRRTALGAGVDLGPLNPEGLFERTTDVSYDATDFQTESYDGPSITAMLRGSPKSQAIVDELVIPGTRPKALDRTYTVFAVEAVFAASDIHVTSTTGTQLKLRSAGSPRDCAAKPVPQGAAQPEATQPAAGEGGTGGVTVPAKATTPPGATSKTQALLAGASPIPPAHVELCLNRGNSYTLSTDQPVPIGMTLVEVRYENDQLVEDGAKPSDLGAAFHNHK